jgi:putative phage-type endonuclease
MKIHNLEQQTPEWFEVRKGKMTSSNATCIGNAGSGLETYVKEIVLEMYTSADKERFSTRDTERGNELEPIARDLYELETGNAVEQVGFIELDEYTGASTDGLIGKDGVWECKAPNDKEYFELLLTDKIKSDYIWQVQMEMLVTGRKWADLTFYNPNFKKPMLTFRLERDEEKLEKLRLGIEKGKTMIENLKKEVEEKLKN